MNYYEDNLGRAIAVKNCGRNKPYSIYNVTKDTSKLQGLNEKKPKDYGTNL